MVGEPAGTAQASLNLLMLFNAITILSFVLIAIIVGTVFFSKYVRPRPKVWYGQMIQWMIYCVAYMLLLGFRRGEEPQALCLFQASLIYACPPACAVGSACFMADLYMTKLPLHQDAARRIRGLEPLLIALPWAALVCTALQVIVFVVGGRKIDTLQRGAFFCNVTDQEPTVVSVIIVLVTLVVWFYFEVRIGIIMYQTRLEFKQINYDASRRFVSLYIRSAILTMGMLMGIGLTIYCTPLSMEQNIPWSVLLPFMPIFVAIVFGSQRDIMRVWIFWRKRSPEEKEAMPSMGRLSLALESDDVPMKLLTAP